MARNDLQQKYQSAVLDVREAARAIDEAPETIASAELSKLTDAFKRAEVRADGLKRELELYERTAEARGLASTSYSDIRVSSEPLTYERGNGQSFFKDLMNQGRDPSASLRLSRHQDEMRVEQPEKFDLSSTDSAGGYLVAPLYLQNELVTVARPHRAAVDAIGTRALPPNTDSINIPTIDTGTAVELQSSDNSSVQETDATFSTVAADVKTIAGMQDVSRQVVDRGVPSTDQVIFSDLVADYARRFDSWVITSSTSNAKGLLDVSGTNAVTYTDTTPTVAELYPKLASCFNEIATNIYAPGNLILMHPRRWAWMLSALDGSNRPLIAPAANNPQNASGTMSSIGAEGAVGSLFGLPVVLSANIPTNKGTGTNEDRIIVLRREESFIFEDEAGPYLERFDDVGSSTLTVRFRIHQYVAQCHARRPKSISILSGSGCSAPSF